MKISFPFVSNFLLLLSLRWGASVSLDCVVTVKRSQKEAKEENKLRAFITIYTHAYTNTSGRRWKERWGWGKICECSSRKKIAMLWLPSIFVLHRMGDKKTKTMTMSTRALRRQKMIQARVSLQNRNAKIFHLRRQITFLRPRQNLFTR